MGAANEFPDLTSDLISLANHLSKATTRKKLGNPTSVIEEFEGKTFEDWERFYEQKHPGALDTASRAWTPTTAQMSKTSSFHRVTGQDHQTPRWWAWSWG